MTENLGEKISYYESPTYSIAKTLKDKGYQIADSTGMRVSEPSHDVLGILESRDPIKKSFLGFKWDEEQRALYKGTLWVDNKARGANPNNHWVLEIYGRNNIQELTELMRELSEPKGIHVQVKLDKEQVRFESYLSDNNY